MSQGDRHSCAVFVDASTYWWIKSLQDAFMDFGVRRAHSQGGTLTGQCEAGQPQVHILSRTQVLMNYLQDAHGP